MVEIYKNILGETDEDIFKAAELSMSLDFINPNIP